MIKKLLTIGLLALSPFSMSLSTSARREAEMAEPPSLT